MAFWRGDPRRRAGEIANAATAAPGAIGIRPAEIETDEHVLPAVELGELRSIVADELSQLPARFRTTLAVCDLEGRSPGRGRAPFGGRWGRSKSRLTRGRARLRAGWHGEDSQATFPAYWGPACSAAQSRYSLSNARQRHCGQRATAGEVPARVGRLRKEW